MPEVVLVYPPISKPSEPPVGVATLAGWLRERGIDCELVDARMEFLEETLDAACLAPFRDRRIYLDPQRHQGTLARLHQQLRRATPPQDRLTVTDHRPADRPLFSRADIRASIDESRVFQPAMQRLAERIASDRPRLVGISIGYLSQLVAALQLLRHLERCAPSLPVVLGGSLVRSWREHLEREGLLDQERYRFGAGQRALAELLGPLGARAGAAVASPRYVELLARHRYLAPVAIGSVALSEGCYWRRCTFCHEAQADRFRPLARRDAEQVLLGLQEQGLRFIHLTDHAISPAALRLLTQVWRDEGVQWYGFVRLHSRLTDPAFARALADAGCVMLEIGLESASPAVLEAMAKGHRPGLASRAIQVLADAGIRVFVYVMFGFPTETDEDRASTLAFLDGHASWIHGLNASIFNLPVGSALEREPERFGIRRLMPFRAGQELSLYRDFVARHDRLAVRRFLSEHLHRSEPLAPVLRRTPRSFKSNHAPFVPLAASGRPSAVAEGSRRRGIVGR